MKREWENMKDERGFTLIELMVIVAIIGLLSSIVMVNLVEARQSAQDAKRIAEMRQIQNALELYRDKTGGYPANGFVNDCSGSSNFKNALKDLVTDGYLPKVSEDPLWGPDNSDFCFSYASPGVTPFTGSSYCESNSDPEYVLIFRAASAGFELPNWQVFGTPIEDYYCLIPPN